MATYSPILGNPYPQYFDSNGAPYVGMRLFFYIAGTSTKQDTVTDSTGAVTNTNPIELDANGYPASNVMIYGDDSLTYKVVAAPPGSDDPPTAPLWTIDNVSTTQSNTSILALLQSTALDDGTKGYHLVYHPLNSYEQSAGVTPTNYEYPPGNVLRYGAAGDGSTDDTQAVQDALDCANAGFFNVYLPGGSYSINSRLELTGSYKGVHIYGDGPYETYMIWDGTSDYMLAVGQVPYTNTVEHITVENMMMMNRGTGKSAIIVQRSSFQTAIKNIRFSNNTNPWTESTITLESYSAGASYPTRMIIDECYLKCAATSGVAQPRGIWIKSGIQILINNTHIQDAEVCYQVGVDSSEYVAAQDYTRNVSGIYFINNTRGQIGGDGGISASAKCIWLTDMVDSTGAAYIEPSDIYIDNCQLYASNNGSGGSGQTGILVDCLARNLQITNTLFDGANVSNSGVYLNNASTEGFIDACTASRFADHLIDLPSNMDKFGVGRIYDNATYAPDSQYAVNFNGRSEIHGTDKFITNNGGYSLEFARLASGAITDIGTISHSASSFNIQAYASLILQADWDANTSGSGSDIQLWTDGAKAVVLDAGTSGAWHPSADNVRSTGTSSNRWTYVYAAGGVLTTSDERLKTFYDIDAAEKAAALEIKANLRKFKYNEAIQEKGEANARIHFGVAAQQVGLIMQSHGLNPENYSFYHYDEWPEQQEITEPKYDKDNNIIGTIVIQEYRAAGNVYSIQYEELLTFIILAI